jgi:predicted DNA-binding transcriptional regulator
MKLSLDTVGLGLNRLIGRRKKVRVSPITQERELFQREVKSQLEELKKKGLSIPVFTL